MKVSQILHKMDRDERVLIYDSEAPITKAELYDGTPRGFKRDNPTLCKTVTGIWADEDTIVLDVGARKKGGRNARRLDER